MIERMRVSEIFREYGIYLVLALLVVGFSIVAPGFASVTNFILILLQVSVMGILSIGMLFVILSRGIDLSVGSILAVSGMFAGLLAKQELSFVNVALAFIVPVALGLLCGMFNGALVAWVRLPALIVTLGTMYAFRGFIVWYHVNPIYQLQPWFRVLGQEKIGPIPIPVIILLVMTFVASVLLNRTRFGRYVYAVGGNEDAARASGINVKLVKLGVYSISGFFCGLAGLVFTSRLGAAQSISGMGFRACRNRLCRGRWREPLRRPRDGREDACRRSNYAGRTKRSRHARRSVADLTGNARFHHHRRRRRRPFRSNKAEQSEVLCRDTRVLFGPVSPTAEGRRLWESCNRYDLQLLWHPFLPSVSPRTAYRSRLRSPRRSTSPRRAGG